MLLKDINPYVRFVRKVGMRRANLRLSRNYDCRLFFFARVDGSINISGKDYKLSNNDVVFLPPASCYQLMSRIDDFEIYSIGLDMDGCHGDDRETFTAVWAENFDPALVFSTDVPEEFAQPIIVNAPNLRGKFDRCYDELRLKPLYYHETASGIVKLILAEMLRRRSFTECESGITNAVIDYIKTNYSNVNLSNDSVAHHFGYHPYYLSRVMKLTTRKTLHKYITEYRVDIAKGFLVSGKQDVSEIARICGFNSASYFTKVFRDECGVTPSVYRREYSEIV